MTLEVDGKIAEYRERGATRAMLGLSDIDGVLRGKFVSLDKLESLLNKGGGFCDCVFGWDVDDQLYDGGVLTGWHTGFPDARYRLLTATERALPDDGTPYFIGEFAARDGGDHPVCPRTLLRQVPCSRSHCRTRSQSRLRVRTVRVRRESGQRARKRVPGAQGR